MPATNLKALTEGIHSREALELVREHLLQIMGPTANAYSNAYVKMSKFQMAQVGRRAKGVAAERQNNKANPCLASGGR